MKPGKWEEIKEQIAEANPDAVLYDGLEDALIGICRRFGQEPVALYDYDKCIEIRLRDGGTYEEVVEFHEYNTMGAGLGEHTPAFLVPLEAQTAQERAISALDVLTGEQKLEILGCYCTGCGCRNPEQGPGCRCWDDD